MRFFSTVAEVFTVPSRGCVIVPAAPADPYVQLRVGDRIQLRQPAGLVVSTCISAIELVKPKSGPSRMALLLAGNVAKSDVPVNTEIWTGEAPSIPQPTIH